MEGKLKEVNSTQNSKRNPFWMGVIITALLFGILFIIYNYFQDSELKKQKAAQELLERKRAGIIADSLRIVSENTARYNKIVKFINSRDSIRNTLRYTIGSVVYLKPDSVRCVIMDITSDSTLSAYSYVLISNNKTNDPGIIIRNDKLIY